MRHLSRCTEWQAAPAQPNHQAAKDKSKKGAPSDVEWLQKMEVRLVAFSTGPQQHRKGVNLLHRQILMY